jgi:hypothetical protein
MKTTTFLTLLFTTLFLGTVSVAKAKPLSYVGGTMVMQENDETGHTLGLDYTFTPSNAFGLYIKQEENGKDILMVTPEFNTLLKRWNLPNGQGNIFNMSGAGLAHYRDSNQPCLWTAFLADYESRRFFASYEPRFVWDGNIEKSVWHRAHRDCAVSGKLQRSKHVADVPSRSSSFKARSLRRHAAHPLFL